VAKNNQIPWVTFEEDQCFQPSRNAAATASEDAGFRSEWFELLPGVVNGYEGNPGRSTAVFERTQEQSASVLHTPRSGDFCGQQENSFLRAAHDLLTIACNN
jgi:hypothetical protein